MRARLSLIAAGALTLGACHPSASGEDALLAAGLSNQYQSRGLVAGEPAALAASHRVARHGDSLSFTLSNGRTLTLQGNPAACRAEDQTDQCADYILLADLPSRHAFLVQKLFYEGDDTLLIDDASGRQTRLPAIPVFSPDGRRMFVQDIDEAYGGDEPLQIWLRSGDTARVEWAYSIRQAHSDARGLTLLQQAKITSWRGDRIELSFSNHPQDRVKRNWTGRLSLTTGGWKLEQDAPS